MGVSIGNSSRGNQAREHKPPRPEKRTLQLETIRLSRVGPPRSGKTNVVVNSRFTFPGGLHHWAPDCLACDGRRRHERALLAPTLNVREFRAEPELIELGPNVGARRLPRRPATLAQVLGVGQQLAG